MDNKVAMSTKVKEHYGLSLKTHDCAGLDKKDWFNDMTIGISSTAGAIAESGTVVLFPSTEEPRQLSLVPPTHIALVEVDKLLTQMNEMFTQ